MTASYSDSWTTVYATDALSGAKLLEPESIHTIICSPPYWGLRSYLDKDHPDKERELGTESTPEAYVEKLVEIFRELRKVLRDDGTLWLNLGGSYNSMSGQQKLHLSSASVRGGGHKAASVVFETKKATPPGFKSKDLIPIPWMVGLALQRDGWWLRADNIWAKPNPMPSSVTDRPTISHEYMLLFSKKPRYYFDQEAVREQRSDTNLSRFERIQEHGTTDGLRTQAAATQDSPYNTHSGARRGLPGVGTTFVSNNPAGRNIRSVWTIATKPFSGSHYACFPPELVYPCIKAGCPEGGVVLDPFMGSGTTAYAARKLGRRSVGFDLDERNLKLIEERLGYQEVLL